MLKIHYLLLLSICQALKFGIIGDSGGLPLVGTTFGQTAVAKSMQQLVNVPPGLDAVLGLGDNVYFTGVSSVDDYRFYSSFEYPYDYPSLDVPWLMIAGNHDHFGTIQSQVDYTNHGSGRKWYMPDLNYKRRFTSSVDQTTIDVVYFDTIVACGNTRDLQSAGFTQFLTSIILASDTHPDGPTNQTLADAQWQWLETELMTSNADYLFVVGHYPVYSISSHGNTQCLIDKLLPMLYRNQVTAYLSGHDHTLQHIQSKEGEQSMDFIVSGAASRADSSTTHRADVEKHAKVKYHYPEGISWLDWLTFSSLSQLGLNDAAFIIMDVDKTNARLDFRDLNGVQKYTTTLPKRVIPL